MFLVQGSVDGPRYLVSTVFDVNAESKVEDLDDLEEIRVPWGTGVVGYVAEKGETVNIANAYEVCL
jgi:dual 3',5'-cyclic-AMP and -GMP phosphodiesterase 11